MSMRKRIAKAKMDSPLILPGRLPRVPKSSGKSYLIKETGRMERARRLLEQQGHRKLAMVNAREHSNEEENQLSFEGTLENGMEQHPALDSQRFDGHDKNVNPNPPQAGTEIRRKHDKEVEDKKERLQNRLGLSPKSTIRNRPRGM